MRRTNRSVSALRSRITGVLGRIIFEGVTPHKLAVTVAIGTVIGIVPLLWGSTVLCALFAFCFGLNQAGIQAANLLSSPLQIIMFAPFYRLGAKLIPCGPPFSMDLLLNGLKNGIRGEIGLLVMATLKAVAAWLVVAPVLAICLYLIMLPVFSRMLARRRFSEGDSLGMGQEFHGGFPAN